MLDFEKGIRDIDFDVSIRKTVWIGDSAVDLDQTDLVQWYREGTGYELRKQEKPSLIRWRGLYPREIKRALATLGVHSRADGEAYPPGHEEALRDEYCRYGLVSIEGLRLSRIDGRLTTSAINSLSLLREDFPDVEEIGGVVGLSWWLGGLISAGSFRRRR